MPKYGTMSSAPRVTGRSQTQEVLAPMLPHLTTPEHWCPAIGYEGIYEVSDLGRVRRTGKARGARIGRILALTAHPEGYSQVQLRRNGRYDLWLVHRLVARTFLGSADGREVNHRNGEKRDNRRSNLEYLTPLENVRHARDVLGVGGSSPHVYCKRGHLLAETRRTTSSGQTYCRLCYNARRAAWKRGR